MSADSEGCTSDCITELVYSYLSCCLILALIYWSVMPPTEMLNNCTILSATSASFYRDSSAQAWEQKDAASSVWNSSKNRLRCSVLTAVRGGCQTHPGWIQTLTLGTSGPRPLHCRAVWAAGRQTMTDAVIQRNACSLCYTFYPYKVIVTQILIKSAGGVEGKKSGAPQTDSAEGPCGLGGLWVSAPAGGTLLVWDQGEVHTRSLR